jgi:hypothetical protein
LPLLHRLYASTAGPSELSDSSHISRLAPGGTVALTMVEGDGTLSDVRGEVRALRGDIADLKASVMAGFAGAPTRAQSDEMLRLLRENNRLQEGRFAELGGVLREQHAELRDWFREEHAKLHEWLREQHLENQQMLHGLSESQQSMTDGQQSLAERMQSLAESQRLMVAENRSLSAEMRALIARLDAMFRPRDNGA